MRVAHVASRFIGAGILIGMMASWCSAQPAEELQGQSPAPTPADEPAYYMIPIVGAVEDNAGEAFNTSIAAARRAKATHIVLVLDSPGGPGPAMKEILLALLAATDLQWIAVVEKANGQVAALVMACPEVLVTPAAHIGGIGVAEAPPNRDAPAAYTAALRAAAQHGGRDELLARGFVERNLLLGMTEDSRTGDVSVVAIHDERDRRGTRLLKRRGDLLILTSDDALKLGVATGTIDALPAINPASPREGLRQVAEALGVEQWRVAGSGAGAMQRATESEARRKYMQQHEETLNKLSRRIRELEQEEAKIRTGITTAEQSKQSVRGAGARRRMDNATSKAQVRLAEVRRQLQVVRDARRKILQAAPRD